MTDHRVTDLSYGHLGKATYDTEDNQWLFSASPKQGQCIQQLLPFGECIPPSVHPSPEKKEKASRTSQQYKRWLIKAHPEMFPANLIASGLTKLHADTPELPFPTGPLLEVGQAVDIDRMSGSGRPQIFAMPCGEGGHILRLMRPRHETRRLGNHTFTKIALLSTKLPEEGFWVGSGGKIHQIEWSNNENGSRTWLAVRQATAITLFRPLYGKPYYPSAIQAGYPFANSNTRLNPNPIVVLTAKETKSIAHVDITFNPWYGRQFAVVDSFGCWSIWDLEQSHRRNPSAKLIPGTRGRMHDDYVPDLALKRPHLGRSDEWHKILWACNINTIIVCNRRNIAVFDIKTKPTRLGATEILPGISTDRILDVKRSLTNLNHVFILTSSRIFWVEIISTGEEKEASQGLAGANIMLSYRHFRDTNDVTMKLTVFRDDKISVLISSSQTLLVNFYCFSKSMEGIGRFIASQGSFLLSQVPYQEERHVSFLALSFLPTTLTETPQAHASRPEQSEDVRFFQVCALSLELGLSFALCAIYSQDQKERTTQKLSITGPSKMVSEYSRRVRKRYMENTFIVPNGFEEQATPYSGDKGLSYARNSRMDDIHFGINWRQLFQRSFLNTDSFHQPAGYLEPKRDRTSMEELLDTVSDNLRKSLSKGNLTPGTLFEISGLINLSGYLEQADLVLPTYLDSLRLEQRSDSNAIMVISDLAHSPAVQFSAHQDEHTDFMKVYDHLVGHWISWLPLQVSGYARLSKFRIIRQMSVEICLSCITASLQRTTSKISTTPVEHLEDASDLPMLNKKDGTTRESSPTVYSYQETAVVDPDVDSRLPTLAQTPSVYSNTTAPVLESSEDPASSRLRQYFVSLNPQSDFGQPSLLSHWPSIPGMDPSEYSWEVAQRSAATAETGEAGDRRDRRAESRRRKRQEKSVKQAEAPITEAPSVPTIVIYSESQPETSHHTFSSQPVGNVPMTQPDRGVFGSRPKNVKKLKKHRTAGF